MSRGSSTFKQTDLKRAVLAMRAAGLEVRRAEVEPSGKIILITGKPGSRDTEANEWDDVG